jgi:putative ABC transport system permease protein
MLKNYLIISWRNLVRNKFFSGINIIGLSIGLTSCILIFLFIQNELTFDKFNVNSKNLFRVASVLYGSGSEAKLAVTPPPWAPIMKREFPEIQAYVRFMKDDDAQMGKSGDEHFHENQILYSDSSLFNVFSLPLVEGDSNTALNRPNTIILTEQLAQKYFGKEDPIGKTLEVKSYGVDFNVEVTGVSPGFPSNSHIHFNAIISMRTWESLGMNLNEMWSSHIMWTYLLVDHSSASELQSKFPAFVNHYITNNPKADGKNDIFLQPITDIHLHSHLVGEIGVNGYVTFIYVFSAVAALILLIACFNFINLTTAKSLTRAKEVGLRKTVGALRRQLVAQFLTETVVVTVCALSLAVILAKLALPLFDQLSGIELELNFSNNSGLIILLLGLILTIGILAGLYPAIALTAFEPVKVLKGKFSRSASGLALRKVLVISQFSVSICLIICTVFVTRQSMYLQRSNPGFNKENVLTLTIPRGGDTIRLESLKNELMQVNDIQAVSASSEIPSENMAVNLVSAGNVGSEPVSMQMLFTDMDFLTTAQIPIIAGRDFDHQMPTDKSDGFIINEEGVRQMGWESPEAAIGKKIQWVMPDAVLKSGKVIGVVKNFNITPLRSTAKPLVILYAPKRFQFLYVRCNQENLQELLAKIHQEFRKFYNDTPFEYAFLDDTISNLYISEQKLGKMLSNFSVLAIFIAGMGVFGLALFTTQQREKDIAIRKVLGASLFGINFNLIKEFVTPIIIASIIATPAALFVVKSWLSGFAYHVPIDWTIFLIVVASVVLFSTAVVSIHSTRAANTDPAESLRMD